jgi:hypothetical protein
MTSSHHALVPYIQCAAGAVGTSRTTWMDICTGAGAVAEAGVGVGL